MKRMDKPEPPQYREYNGAINSVSDKVFQAYKTSPVMIAMIILLLSILGAFGWYQMRNDDRIYSYIAARDQQQADLWDRLVAMAKDCRDMARDKEAYPSLDFPKLTTQPQATPNKRDGK